VPTGVFVRAHEQRLLKAGGASLGKIAEKTGIPKTHLHRYLTDVEHAT
jgi:DNA-binding IclR family transcriptional regulator